MRTSLSLALVVCSWFSMEFEAQSAPSKNPPLGLQLVQAVKARDAARVKRLLRAGANANTRDDSGRAQWERIGDQKVQVWDEKKRAMSMTTIAKATKMKPFLGPTVLMIAARQTDLATAGALLDAGADRNARGADFLATQTRDTNINTEWRCTPLMEAMLAGSPGMMRLLLRRGASVNTPDNEGVTPRVLLENMRPTGLETPAQKRHFNLLLAVLRAHGARRLNRNHP